MTSPLIIEQYEGRPVHFLGDGWFNATIVAKRFGKRVDHWQENAETVQYVEALAKALNTRNPGDLIRTQRGRNGGTWLHPKLGVAFARWLDVDFAVWCDLKIDDILRGQYPAPDPHALSTVEDREPLYIGAVRIMVKHHLSLPVIYRGVCHRVGVKHFADMQRIHVSEASGFVERILAGADTGEDWRMVESGRAVAVGYGAQSRLDLGPLLLGNQHA